MKSIRKWWQYQRIVSRLERRIIDADTLTELTNLIERIDRIDKLWIENGNIN